MNRKALVAFASAAGEYCRLVDSFHDGRPASLYAKLEELLARLLSAIVPAEKETPGRSLREYKELAMTQEQYYDLARIIGGVVGQDAAALFQTHGGAKRDATEAEKYCAARAEMLSDDLADIYRDLRHGLSLWELDTPDAQAAAAWQWRFNYEAHWGGHLFRAMATVHEARYQLCVE
jgi:hypothetical protein